MAIVGALLGALSAPVLQAAQALEQRIVRGLELSVEYTGERRAAHAHPKRRTNAATLKRQSRRRRNIRLHPRGAA